MDKINGINDIDEGDHFLSKHGNIAYHIFVVTYKNKDRLIKFKLLKSLKREINLSDWDRVSSFKKLYKLDNVEFLTYML